MMRDLIEMLLEESRLWREEYRRYVRQHRRLIAINKQQAAAYAKEIDALAEDEGNSWKS